MRISTFCLFNLLLTPQLNAEAKALRGPTSDISATRSLNNNLEVSQVGDDIGEETYYTYSGTSVAMSSDGAFLAVGANGGYGYSGHVITYRFDTETQSWVQRGQSIIGERGGDESGSSISFSNDGNRIAIGAPNNSGYYGHTRVYDFDAGMETWVQLGEDLDGERRDSHSGSSVALSGNGNRLAIGAPNDSTYTGYVKIYEVINGGWTQLGPTIVGDGYYTSLGNSVAMSDNGQRVIIGAHYDYLNADRFVGSVRVYEYVDVLDDWVIVGSELKGEAYFDMFGHSVDINGDGSRIVIGTPNEDNGSTSNVGKAEVYEYDSDFGDWQLRGSAVMGDVAGEQLGQTVSINGDGNRIVVGSGFCDEGGNDAGCTWVFGFDDSANTWSQIGSTIYGEAAGDRSGKSLAMSADGQYFAVGAPDNEFWKGHTRVYKINDTNPCNNPSLRLLSIEITTDSHGESDNRFHVKQYDEAVGKFKAKVFVQNTLPSSETVTFETCLPVDACYRFNLFDTAGDGLCCEHGEGRFKVTWGDKIIKEIPFWNGSRRSAFFGDTCTQYGF